MEIEMEISTLESKRFYRNLFRKCQFMLVSRLG
jgi:hypothetical protein